MLVVFFFFVHHFQRLSFDPRSDLGASDIGDNLVDPNEGGPRVRQATTTLHDEYDPVFERAIKSHIKHGEAWGYPTHVLRYSMFDGTSQYNKISYLQMLLLNEMAKPYGQRAGWIVWFDADTIILNPMVPWTTFLPPTKFPNIHLVASKNWDGFNSGVFFLRVHEWSVKMLADAQALPSLRPEITIQWADQGAMLESFSRPQFRDAVVFQPMHWYNEFQLQESMVKDRPNVHPGDMLIHFAGLAKDKRQFMGPWLDKVENVADQWTVPLEDTNYVRDVERYWDTYGHAKDMLDRANNTLLLKLSDPELRQPAVKAFEDLQNTVWKAAEDLDRMRSHTESLADTLRQAIHQDLATRDQLRAEKV